MLRYAFPSPFILCKCEKMENCNTVPYLYTHGMITLPYQCVKFYSCFQVSVHCQHRVLNRCNSITKFYSSYDTTDAIHLSQNRISVHKLDITHFYMGMLSLFHIYQTDIWLYNYFWTAFAQFTIWYSKIQSTVQYTLQYKGIGVSVNGCQYLHSTVVTG